LNQVMKRMTAIATIFMPLTFLTGFFGMNFEQLPFQSPWALVLALISMTIIPGGMWLWMRRARWFERFKLGAKKAHYSDEISAIVSLILHEYPVVCLIC